MLDLVGTHSFSMLYLCFIISSMLFLFMGASL